jgi:GTPase
MAKLKKPLLHTLSLTPKLRKEISPPLSLDELIEQDFDELVDEWEREIIESGNGICLSQDIISEQDKWPLTSYSQSKI